MSASVPPPRRRQPKPMDPRSRARSYVRIVRPVDTLIVSLLQAEWRRSGTWQDSGVARRPRSFGRSSRRVVRTSGWPARSTTRCSASPPTRSGVELLGEAFDRWPREARLRAAERVFDELPAERRWEILAELFDEAELRAALESERDHQVVEARRTLEREALASTVRDRQALDTRDVPADEELTLGLFREVDVRAVLTQGARRRRVRPAAGAARHGRRRDLRVIEDVFNPSARPVRHRRLRRAGLERRAAGAALADPDRFPRRVDVRACRLPRWPRRRRVGWRADARPPARRLRDGRRCSSTRSTE